MRKNFCPACGREIKLEEMVNGMCTECYIKKTKIIEFSRWGEITICPKCGSFYEGGWKKSKSIEDAAVAFIPSKILISNEIEDVELNLSPERLDSKSMIVHVELKGKIRAEKIEKKLDLLVHIRYNVCERCSRISGGYYESIVQIRAYDRNPNEGEREGIKKLVDDRVKKGYDGGDEKSFITDLKEFEGGLDLYLGSKKIAREICESIRSMYGGDLLESPKLVGEEDGRKKYRITYSLRLPKFSMGDIISFGGRVIQIRKMGKRMMGRDLLSGKTMIFDGHRLKGAKKVGSIKEAVETVL